MYIWMWVAAFAGAIWASHALYVKDTIRSAAFMSIINICLWAVVGLGATGVEVLNPETGETVIYSSSALAAFAISMAVFGLIVFVISITIGYGEDDGSDEPAMDNIADARNYQTTNTKL